MKKLTKFLSLVLIAAFFSGCIIYQQAEAKDIYFAGKYKSGKYVISLNQYSEKSSYKVGETCGNLTLTYKGSPMMGGHTHGDIVFDGTKLKKTGKNKYIAKDQMGYKCTITVKKKSIYAKFTKSKGAWSVGKNGTYALKKRYYS